MSVLEKRKNKVKKEKGKKIDWLITIVPFVLIISLFVLFIILPERSNEILGRIRFFLGNTFGSYYIMIGIVFLGVSIYLAVSEYGDIILGNKEGKPQHSFFFMGSDDVYLRIGSRYFILFFLRMDDVCFRSAYCGVGNCSGVGGGISVVSLEHYTVELLSGTCSSVWIYAACPKQRETKIFRSLPVDFGKAYRWYLGKTD